MSDPFYNDQAVTPARDLRVLLDVDETVMVAPGEEIARAGEQIARGTVAGAGTSTNVVLRDGLWGISPLNIDAAHLSEETTADPGKMRLANFNHAAHLVEFPISRADSDLPGVTPGPNVSPSGDWFIRKNWIAGVSLADVLTADVAVIPQPVLASLNYPMDRVAVGKDIDGANTAYTVRLLMTHHGSYVPDNICTFYFGGAWGNPLRGAYAATFHGSGFGSLFAFDPYSSPSASWFLVMGFQWAQPNEVSGRQHTIIFEPKGRGLIGIRVPSSGAAQTHGASVSTGPRFGASPPDPSAARFNVNAFVGLSSTNTVTGPGEVRMDVRRNLLLGWQITRGVWFPTGQLIDHPAVFARPPQQYVYLKVYSIPYDGGTLTPQLYLNNDPSAPITGEQMSEILWRFDVAAAGASGARSFGAIYNFTSDTLGTPYLQKGVLFIDPRTEFQTGLKIPFTPNESTFLGFDGDPARPTASFVWEDMAGDGVLLRKRARIHSKLQVAYLEKIEARIGTLGTSETVLVSNLFDGEVSDCPGDLKGYDDGTWPSPYWRRFNGTMAGIWVRGMDQFNFNRMQFVSPDTRNPITGELLLPKLTDVIYQVFSQGLGVPDSELDIPDVDIRLIPSGPQRDDFFLQPKQKPLDFIRRIADQFLGYAILRDDNAGLIGSDHSAVGMWRLRPRLSPFVAHTPLWRFVFGPPIPQQPQPDPNPFPPPTGGGPTFPITEMPGPVHSPQSYPPNTSFISRIDGETSYSDKVIPPEANFILVIAADQTTNLPNDAGMFKTFAALPNPKSYNFDPDNPTATDRTHPDFLGRFVPLVLIDYTLSGVPPELGGPQGACWALAYALMDLVGHGRKQATFHAPLALVADSNDPLQARRRPLYFDDPITINGFPAILKSCHGDPPLQVDRQFAWHQAQFMNGRWDGTNWIVDPNGSFPM